MTLNIKWASRKNSIAASFETNSLFFQSSCQRSFLEIWIINRQILLLDINISSNVFLQHTEKKFTETTWFFPSIFVFHVMRKKQIETTAGVHCPRCPRIIKTPLTHWVPEICHQYYIWLATAIWEHQLLCFSGGDNHCYHLCTGSIILL